MGKHVAGMILGTVCIIASLVFLTCVNICVAAVLRMSPGFDPASVETFRAGPLASSIIIIGAVVLLLNTALMALEAARRPGQGRAQQSEAAPADK